MSGREHFTYHLLPRLAFQSEHIHIARAVDQAVDDLRHNDFCAWAKPSFGSLAVITDSVLSTRRECGLVSPRM